MLDLSGTIDQEVGQQNGNLLSQQLCCDVKYQVGLMLNVAMEVGMSAFSGVASSSQRSS